MVSYRNERTKDLDIPKLSIPCYGMLDRHLVMAMYMYTYGRRSLDKEC